MFSWLFLRLYHNHIVCNLPQTADEMAQTGDAYSVNPCHTVLRYTKYSCICTMFDATKRQFTMAYVFPCNFMLDSQDP